MCALFLAAPASATRATHDQARAVRAARTLVDHYRAVTWTFERAAHRHRTPTAYLDRRSTDPAYLRWAVEEWTRRAYTARRAALARIEHRLAIDLPSAPRIHSRLSSRVSYSRRLALRLRTIYPGTVSRTFAHARRPTGAETLRLWQERGALAALAVAAHGVRRAHVPVWLHHAFLCIHRYEGPWDANSGNGYYGGLQMDIAFQGLYGSHFLHRWGTADNWPAWAQIEAAARAYHSGRGFGPWPSTARACGLI